MGLHHRVRLTLRGCAVDEQNLFANLMSFGFHWDLLLGHWPDYGCNPGFLCDIVLRPVVRLEERRNRRRNQQFIHG